MYSNFRLTIAAIMILLMQVGFALFEAGSVREKNVANVLIKNVVDTVGGALIFYLVGYGFTKELQGGVIGTGGFAEINFTKKDYLFWLIAFSFNASCATIVSGALAERTFMDTYLCF
jgi:Amt family ammonium transporter